MEKTMTTDYDDLKQMIAVENANMAFVFSDSLLQILTSKKKENCTISFWIGYYQGESLELLMDFESALKVYYKIIKNAEQQNEWEIVTHCYISVARCFEFLNRDKDCLRYLEMANELIKKHKLDKVEPTFAFRYSSYHRIFGSLDSAVVYAQYAVDSGKKLDIIRAQTDGYLLLGILHKDLESSTKYFRQAATLFYNNKNYLGAASMYKNIASRYWRANMPTETISAVDTAKMLTTYIIDKNKSYYQILSQIAEIKKNYFEQKNDIDSAYIYLNLTRDSEKKSEWMVNQEKIVSDAIGFALEKEKIKLENVNQKSNYLRNGLILMSILSFVLMWLIYKNRLKTKQISIRNSIIDQNNIALQESLNKHNTLLSEVHHRVKNNLQLVISMITVLSRKSNNDEQQLLLKNVSNKVHSIALIHEQLYQNSDFEKIDLGIYLDELVLNFKELQSEYFEFKKILIPEKISLNIETAIPLGIILSELINNSLKYGIIPNNLLVLKINLTLSNKKYILTYRDNGPGYKETIMKENRNMGFSIVYNMIRQLQAESTMYNENGAVFTIIFEEKTTSKI